MKKKIVDEVDQFIVDLRFKSPKNEDEQLSVA